MMVYRVVDWQKNFENSETRKLKHLRWVPVPNKHDGAAYGRLWSGEFPDAPGIFGAWVLILEVASKCSERGTLAKDGTAIGPREMSQRTRCPEPTYAAAFPALVTIGWLEQVEYRENLPASPETSGAKGREGKGIENASSVVVVPKTIQIGKNPPVRIHARNQ